MWPRVVHFVPWAPLLPYLSPVPIPCCEAHETRNSKTRMHVSCWHHRHYLLGSVPKVSPASGTPLDGDAAPPEGSCSPLSGRDPMQGTHWAFSLHSGEWPQEGGAEDQEGRGRGWKDEAGRGPWRQCRCGGQPGMGGILIPLWLACPIPACTRPLYTEGAMYSSVCNNMQLLIWGLSCKRFYLGKNLHGTQFPPRWLRGEDPRPLLTATYSSVHLGSSEPHYAFLHCLQCEKGAQ